MAKITIAKPMGAIFASAITSTVIPTSNYQKLTFVVFNDAASSGSTKTTVKAKGVDGSGTAHDVKLTYKGTDGTASHAPAATQQVTLDGHAHYFEVDIHQGYAKYELTTTAVSGSTVNGIVLAIQDNPIHSEL